jgi:hypothetical protein
MVDQKAESAEFTWLSFGLFSSCFFLPAFFFQRKKKSYWLFL